MRILVVKLTSMGDTLHLLPALSDLYSEFPDVVVDWMIEDSFCEIPTWHNSVDKVIPVSTRRWRSLNLKNVREFLSFVKNLREHHYDVILDAQGLMKSAALSRFGKLNKGGRRVGFSAGSIKEKPAARFYTTRLDIARQQHAVDRLRQLFACAFGYAEHQQKPDYAVNISAISVTMLPAKAILLFPGTTWASKHIPDQTWRDVVDAVLADGYSVAISWGNEKEKKRAQWIAKGHANAMVLKKSSLTQLATMLLESSGAIAVDTGLGHLAAALGVPAVSVYGSTAAALTGAVGENQNHLQSDYPCSPCFQKQCAQLTTQVTEPPCYQKFTASDIWEVLFQKII